jgi:hypothetical protein
MLGTPIFDTRIPSFNNSSDAIRSSPQVRFLAAIAAISRCRSVGNRGCPRGLDFQRQNNWKPLRCHRMSVSGFTSIRMRPVDQPRQRHERNPSRMVSAARLHLPLHVQRQLLSQEQILGGESCMRSPCRRDQPKEITSDAVDGSKRGAGTRLGHGRRIVREVLVQQRPSLKYRTAHDAARRDKFAKICAAWH